MSDYAKTITSDDYRKFIFRFRSKCAEERWDYERVAETMNVHPNTIRNWWSFRSIMDGEAVLRCIRLIFGGYSL